MGQIRKGDDTVGHPHRAQILQFELFELTLLLKLDKQLSIEQFEAAVSQSTVPSPPLLQMRMMTTLCLKDVIRIIRQLVIIIQIILVMIITTNIMIMIIIIIIIVMIVILLLLVMRDARRGRRAAPNISNVVYCYVTFSLTFCIRKYK